NAIYLPPPHAISCDATGLAGVSIMTRFSQWMAALAVSFLSTRVVRAQVEDTAGLFKPETVQEANARIERIHKQAGKQVAVFTVKEIPEERKKGRNVEGAFADAEERRKMFDEWARERMRERRIEGVHILICQNPRHIEITVSEDTEPLFGKWYRDHLRKRL